jgi:hypothetical protein
VHDSLERFARTHGADLGCQFFDKDAHQELQDQLVALSLGDEVSLRACFVRLPDIVGDNLSTIVNGNVRLADAQRVVLRGVHRRINANQGGASTACAHILWVL